MGKMSEADSDRQQIERLTDVIRPPSFAESARAGCAGGAANDSAQLQACHARLAKLEYALAEIISISRDNRITQIALRAIDIRELV